jgi:hypothetical protein
MVGFIIILLGRKIKKDAEVTDASD